MTETRQYFCCRMKQRGDQAVSIAVFVALAKDIAKWSGVRRVGEHEEGNQRIRKPTRVNSIKRFLVRDNKNTIPTSVVVAFDQSVINYTQLSGNSFSEISYQETLNGVSAERLDWGIISFKFDPMAEEHQRPALIVDGQHRLYGMALVDEPLPLLVAAILDATSVEQAFQFIVINSKAVKVQIDNVKSIIASFDENDLTKRLATARINYKETPGTLMEIDTREDSPFRGLLDWPTNTTGPRLVKPTTIETCLRYIRSTFPSLRDGDDEDTVRELLIALWKAARDNYLNLWAKNDKFMSKVCLTALGEYAIDRIDAAVQDGSVDIYEPE